MTAIIIKKLSLRLLIGSLIAVLAFIGLIRPNFASQTQARTSLQDKINVLTTQYRSNIYVDWSNDSDSSQINSGDGTAANPYRSVTSALNEVSNLRQQNVYKIVNINIKGYCEEFDNWICHFDLTRNHSNLTLRRWDEGDGIEPTAVLAALPISLNQTSSIQISNLTLMTDNNSNQKMLIYIANSNDIDIYANHIHFTGMRAAIYAADSYNVNVQSNVFSGSGTSIDFDTVNKKSIISKNVFDNSFFGIAIYNCNGDIEITNNNFKTTNAAVSLIDSKIDRIRYNLFTDAYNHIYIRNSLIYQDFSNNIMSQMDYMFFDNAQLSFFNNTIYYYPNQDIGAFVNIDMNFDSMGLTTDMDFYDNIFTSTNGTVSVIAIEGSEESFLNFDYNLFYNQDGSSVHFREDGKIISLADWIYYANDTHSVFQNPLFVNWEEENYELQSGSPAINAGINILDSETDYAGNTRIQDGVMDIGALEYQ